MSTAEQSPVRSDRRPGESTTAFLGYFCRRYPRRTALAIALLLLANAFEAVSLVALFPLVAELSGDTVAAGSGFSSFVRRGFATLGVPFRLEPLLGVIIVGISVKGVLSFMARRSVGYAAAQVTTTLRLELIDAFLRARWSHLSRRRTGDLTSAVTQEVAAAGDGFYTAAALIGRVIQALLYAIVIALVSWQAALFAVVAGGLLLVLLNRAMTTIRAAGRRKVDASRSFVNKLLDTVQSHKAIRGMGASEPFRGLLERDAQAIRRSMKARVAAAEALQAAREPLLAVFIAVGVVVAVHWFHYSFTAIALLGFLFWRVVAQINRIHTNLSSVAHLEPFFWSAHRVIDDLRGEEEAWPGRLGVPSDGSVVFDDVHFSHDDCEVLRGLTFTLPPGSLTALEGPSGAGKTTVTDLLLGLIRPQRGGIRVGGTDLSEIDLAAWRRAIGFVPQEPVLIHGTMRANVSLGDDRFSDEDIWRALTLAGAAEFVESLDGGLARSVGERGERLSAGQRQRILLARALVRRPRLLVLDEATAALDSESERQVIDTLVALKGEVTVLAVTHRAALAEKADQRIALDRWGPNSEGEERP